VRRPRHLDDGAGQPSDARDLQLDDVSDRETPEFAGAPVRTTTSPGRSVVRQEVVDAEGPGIGDRLDPDDVSLESQVFRGNLVGAVETQRWSYRRCSVISSGFEG